MPSEQPPVSTPPTVDYRKTDTFRQGYANNVFLEYTPWDLKLVFGQIDQSLGPNVVSQHTAITVPWPQVKVFLYFLSMHLKFRETDLGRVIVPQNVINPPAPPDPSTAGDFPNALRLYEIMKRAYDEFLAENPEAKSIKK